LQIIVIERSDPTDTGGGKTGTMKKGRERLMGGEKILALCGRRLSRKSSGRRM